MMTIMSSWHLYQIQVIATTLATVSLVAFTTIKDVCAGPIACFHMHQTKKVSEIICSSFSLSVSFGPRLTVLRGRNVCIYYLLSACKFGDTKCIYAHSKEDLPKTRGWWNDEKQIEKVKGVLELAETKLKEQRALSFLLRKAEAKAKKSRGGKIKAEVDGAAKQAKKKSMDEKRSKKRGPQSAKDLGIEDKKVEEHVVNGKGDEVRDPLESGHDTLLPAPSVDRTPII